MEKGYKQNQIQNYNLNLNNNEIDTDEYFYSSNNNKYNFNLEYAGGGKTYRIKEEIRKKIIYKVFDINLTFETNISTLIIARVEWESAPFSLLPIHAYIEEEGVPL